LVSPDRAQFIENICPPQADKTTQCVEWFFIKAIVIKNNKKQEQENGVLVPVPVCYVERT